VFHKVVDTEVCLGYFSQIQKNKEPTATRMNTTTSNPTTTLIRRILRPLVRILLRHGISHAEFAETAKRVYVDVAEHDFLLEDRRQTASRISVLTGLNRKDVKKIQDEQAGLAPRDPQKNRIERVINGWMHDPEFVATDGSPLTLPLEGDRASFAALVRRHSGDMTDRSVLDELCRIGAVNSDASQQVRLVKPGYIPTGDLAELLDLCGTAANDLLSTLDFNTNEPPQRRLQLQVAYDNLPVEALDAFRNLSDGEARKLLQVLNQWLARHDRDVTPSVQGTGRHRAGIGIYYFEQDLGDPPTDTSGKTD
jgi:hypothetical protein